MAPRISVAALSIVLAVAVGATRFGFDVTEATQQNPAVQGTQPAHQHGEPDVPTTHGQQMMAEMKAADARLDALVRDMNAATGEAKVSAIAALLSELVQQHESMHSHMEQMHQQMMGQHSTMPRR
jgi:hypothetical protein